MSMSMAATRHSPKTFAKSDKSRFEPDAVLGEGHVELRELRSVTEQRGRLEASAFGYRGLRISGIQVLGFWV